MSTDAMSDFLEDLFAEISLNNAATAIGSATMNIALFTTLQSDDGVDGVEPVNAVTPYARIGYTGGFTVATGSGVTTAKNTSAITFAIAGTTWLQVVGFGIYVSTDLYYHGDLTLPVQINVNDTFEFAIDALVITFE